MCGIAGFIGFNDDKLTQPLCESIKHRGPDDFGTFQQDRIFLGHRRLSIIDLSETGHQPMFSPDGKFALIFNGEIYNHLDLRASHLLDKTFRSHSDTETVLIGFATYGVEFFKVLNGIFSLAIYNIETGELVIARDQFGVKPLYYYAKDDILIFSSEIKAIINYQFFDNQIDYRAIVNYLNFLWSPGEMTMFNNIKKLLPGHFIKVEKSDPANFIISKFYDIPFDGVYSTKSENELVNDLENLLLKAVERQLLSDVPIGFFLSGGLDSSLIVAMAKKINGDKPLTCFTINSNLDNSEDGFSNDLEYAQKVAKFLSVNLEVIDANVDIIRDFDKMIFHLDEPQADPAPLNVLNICTAAKKMGFKVLVGGTAGDDLFSGYRRHQAVRIDRIYSKIPLIARSFLRKAFLMLPVNSSFSRRVNKYMAGIDKDGEEKMAGYFSWFPKEKIMELFTPQIRNEIGDFDPNAFLYDLTKNIPAEKDPLNVMLYWEMKSFLVDHNLNYTDKLSMATGVEVRVPFLDLDLVNFSTRIPPSLKLKGTTTKYILKKVAEKYLPHEVVYRSKAGFGAPVRHWIKNDMADMIARCLSKETIETKGIFDYEKVADLIQQNKRNKIDASYTIWSLLAISSWFDQFYQTKQK
jgi:asparagine synthase (glutamine-hydrolysing)